MPVLRAKDISDYYQQIQRPNEKQLVGIVGILTSTSNIANAVVKTLAMGAASVGYNAAASGTYIVLGASDQRIVINYMTPAAKMGQMSEIALQDVSAIHTRNGMFNRVIFIELLSGQTLKVKVGRWAIGHPDHTKRFKKLLEYLHTNK